jgi:hypothetical protein
MGGDEMTVRDDWRPAFFWIVGILVSIMVIISTWTMDKASMNGGRLDVIEDSKFTKSDARDMEIRMRAEVMGGFDEIKDCLNKLQQKRQCE